MLCLASIIWALGAVALTADDAPPRSVGAEHATGGDLKLRGQVTGQRHLVWSRRVATGHPGEERSTEGTTGLLGAVVQWGEAAGLRTVECVRQREFVSCRGSAESEADDREWAAAEAFQCLVQAVDDSSQAI